MGRRQIETIERGVREAYRGVAGPDDEPKFSCTLESRSAAGGEVWVQVIPGTVNMAYPFDDDPLDRLGACGVDAPPALDLIEWDAGSYAAFDVGGVPARDQALFVDRLFVLVLGCDDEYELATSVEVLDA
jgi:hypothetical protein